MRRLPWLLLLASACAGARALEADRAYQAGLAKVERIEVRVHDERPVSVLSAYGELPDGCTEIDRTLQDRRVSGIDVRLTTRRDSGASCAPEARRFERGILLAIEGLPSGLYFVNVNGVQGTFQILEDFGARDRFERY
jgi:inhibitor of cysteine peptidase